MKHTRFAKVLVAMFAGVLMVAALADARSRIRGRATAIREPSVHDSGQPNYGRLKSRLESFTDAVSRGDVVGMRTQADNAFKAIDDLNNLTSPTPQGYPEGVRRRHGRSQGRAELLYRPVYGNRQRHRGTALRLFHVRSAHPGYQVEVREGIGKLQSGDNKASELPE